MSLRISENMATGNDWKSKLGIVYSTNPDFIYPAEDSCEEETLPAGRQRLRVHFERAGRGGKTVTVITGFKGAESDLGALCRQLKSKLGIGGSAKDGEIILQGNVCGRVVELLKALGYTRSG